MPQRTRKEKIAASRRRLQKETLPAISINYKPVAEFKKAEKLIENIKVEKTESKQMAYEVVTRDYFTHDFRKSVFFICIIFALEFFLYFVRIGKYLVR